MHFPMVVNWREKKECGHDAKEGADMDSVHSAVPLKSVGLNLLTIVAFISVEDGFGRRKIGLFGRSSSVVGTPTIR